MPQFAFEDRTQSPAAPESPQTRWESFFVRAHHPVVRDLRKTVWSGQIAKLIGGLARRCETGDPPTSDEETNYLRGVMGNFMREMALLGNVRAFDAFRDLFFTLFAYHWPAFVDECQPVEPDRDFPSLLDLHNNFSRLFAARAFDEALHLCRHAFAELASAQGVDSSIPARLHRKILERMSAQLLYQPRVIANEVIRAAPLYDGVRFRLVGELGQHALSVQALVGPTQRLHVHEWGVVYGLIRGEWCVVGFD